VGERAKQGCVRERERDCWPELSVVTRNGSQGSAISFSSFLQFMTSLHTPTARPTQ